MSDASGQAIAETKYKAWGEVRQATGTSPTNYTYTGQYSYTADFGLMFYNARWYDPALGRFAQADTIVPGGVQGLDRYAYVNNSPMNYVDPSGHLTCDADGFCDQNWAVNQQSHGNGGGSAGGGRSGRSGGSGSPDDRDEGESGCHGLCLLTTNNDNQSDILLNFSADGCDTRYECGGDDNMGYIIDPITGIVAIWSGGKHSSFWLLCLSSKCCRANSY